MNELCEHAKPKITITNTHNAFHYLDKNMFKEINGVKITIKAVQFMNLYLKRKKNVYYNFPDEIMTLKSFKIVEAQKTDCLW